MERQRRSNLKDFVPLWEREFADRVHETEFDRILQGDVNITEASGGENLIRQRGPSRARCFQCVDRPPAPP